MRLGRVAPFWMILTFLACDDAGGAAPTPVAEAITRVDTTTVARTPPKEEPPAPPPVKKSPYRYVDLQVRSSLEASFVNATDTETGQKLAQVTKRVLVWWINVRRELLKNDRLEVVYELPGGDEEPIVHAVWFHSQKLQALKVAVRHQLEGERFPRYYDADGVEVERHLINSPIADYEQVTSLLGDGRGHRGVDFKTPIGTMVRSPFNGRVLRRNWARRRNGNCLEIVDSKTGLHAYFLHLSSIAKRVRPGRRIRKGQLLARSGNTGRSSAPHLHYQLERRGRAVDPFRVHRTKRKRLTPEQTAEVKAALERFSGLRTGSS